jgi:hypothetical protein
LLVNQGKALLKVVVKTQLRNHQAPRYQ